MLSIAFVCVCGADTLAEPAPAPSSMLEPSTSPEPCATEAAVEDEDREIPPAPLED